MQNRYESLIKEFEGNIKKLISDYQNLKKENDTLKSDIENKREELMKAHKEILDLRNDYALLQTADGLSGSAESREKSRKHLVKIVQEIDKCLVLLNE